MAPEADHDIKDDDEKNPRPLDEDDIALLKTYVIFPSFPFSFFLSFLLQTLITTMWISLFIFSSIHSFLLLLYCYAMFSCSRLDFYYFIIFFLLQQNQIMLVNWVGGMDLQV